MPTMRAETWMGLVMIGIGPLLPAIPEPASAAMPDWVQSSINIAKSRDKSVELRVDKANSLTNSWQESLPVLMQNLDSYWAPSASRTLATDSVQSLIPLTDLVASIVVNKQGAVEAFRSADLASSGKTVDLLAAAAGGQDRSLRYNASYILAAVVDDANLCILLHHLRDPDFSADGQANLLQIATSAVSNASRDNVKAAADTATRLQQTAQGQAAALATLLGELATARLAVAPATPGDSYCARYNVDTGELPPVAAASAGGTAPAQK